MQRGHPFNECPLHYFIKLFIFKFTIKDYNIFKAINENSGLRNALF